MNKLGLKWRIVLPIGIMLVVGITAIVIIIAVNYSNAMSASVNQNLEEMAYRYANTVKADMEMSLGAVKVLSTVLGNAAGTDRADREYYIKLMQQVVMENRSLFGAWACFEPNAFDGKDAEYVNKDNAHDSTGRFISYNYMDSDTTTKTEALTGYTDPVEGQYYLAARDSGHENLTQPYYYDVNGKPNYITSVAVPVIKGGKAVGVAGGDLQLKPICDSLRAVKLFDNGYLSLFDDKGFFVYSPDEARWTKDAKDSVNKTTYAALTEALRTGKPQVFKAYSLSDKKMVMHAMCPFTVGATGKTWVMRCTVPEDEATAQVYYGVMLIIAVGVAVLVLSLLTLYFKVGGVARVLSDIGANIHSASMSVTEASGSISEASNSLAEGATEQAASLEETSSALEEMASMTRQNADNANKTNETNQNNNKLISEGADAVRNMSTAMGEINESAEKISRIIKTIEDIAFQTNLLALNAAVEAARAGESGKGFAVVADEVRNLAQRSAQAARDTTELIGGTVERVRNGSEIAAVLDNSFKEIEEGSTRVSRLIADIASATNEQAQGVDQVNTAVAQMDKVTQQNAANAEETASVTTGLSQQAEALDTMVGELSRLISGGNGIAQGPVEPKSRAVPPRGGDRLMLGYDSRR